MAGRSTPGRTPSTNIPMAMAAPVLPADTRASHSPDLQSSAATRSDESRLRRTAWAQPSCNGCGACARGSWNVFASAAAWRDGSLEPGRADRPGALSMQSIRERLERGPAWIPGGGRAGAGHRVPVDATGRAQPLALLAAEGLHGQPEGSLGLEQRAEIDLVMVVDVALEVAGPELPLLPATGAGDEARVNIGLHLRLVRLEAARAHLGHARVQPTVDEDRVAILGDGQAH